MKTILSVALVIGLGLPLVTQVATVPGDLNGDGAVDLCDYAIMQNNFSGPIPLWLQERVEYYESRPAANRPAFIARYWYTEQWVYYRPSYCCDVPGVVWDAAGTAMCSPGGGLGGEGTCPDFLDESTDEWVVWVDG